MSLSWSLGPSCIFGSELCSCSAPAVQTNLSSSDCRPCETPPTAASADSVREKEGGGREGGREEMVRGREGRKNGKVKGGREGGRGGGGEGGGEERR